MMEDYSDISDLIDYRCEPRFKEPDPLSNDDSCYVAVVGQALQGPMPVSEAYQLANQLNKEAVRCHSAAIAVVKDYDELVEEYEERRLARRAGEWDTDEMIAESEYQLRQAEGEHE